MKKLPSGPRHKLYPRCLKTYCGKDAESVRAAWSWNDVTCKACIKYSVKPLHLGKGTKYDVSAIDVVGQKTRYLVKSNDGELIMRSSESGDFTLIAHDQNTVVHIPRKDALQFALWILCSIKN